MRGAKGIAKGDPINVIGRVVDLRGRPVRGVRLDLWQANAVGRYDHPGDHANPAALDPNFQGFARLVDRPRRPVQVPHDQAERLQYADRHAHAAHPFRHPRAGPSG